MDFKLGSTTGTKVRDVSSRFLPEVLLSLGMRKNEVDSYSPKVKSDFLQHFAATFDHNEFYADLTNKMKKNPGLVMMEIIQKMEIKDKERFLELYLKIDREDSDFTADIKSQLDEVRFNNGKKAKKERRPQLTPTPSIGSDEDKKKKRKDEYNPYPPKLRL